MDLATNGVVISGALKYVERKAETIDTLQKTDKRIEAIEEEETTTGGIF